MLTKKLLYGLITCLTLLVATGAKAALVNFEVFGTVDFVDESGNIYALSIGDSVSATGMFDDSGLAGGSGTIDFTDPGNSISLNIGSRTFTESDDGGTPSLTLDTGAMTDLDFLASEQDAFGQSVLFSFFTTFQGTDNLVGSWDGASFSMTPVPVPAAVWLFGSGLLGLAGIARRRR